jgi:ribosomal protein S13
MEKPGPAPERYSDGSTNGIAENLVIDPSFWATNISDEESRKLSKSIQERRIILQKKDEKKQEEIKKAKKFSSRAPA